MQQESLKTGASLLAQVNVKDTRAPGIAASKREAAFGVPMGNVTFDPPEVQIVKNMLESELTKIMSERGIQKKKDFTCDIVEFGVNTNTTPVYWDVIGRIKLVLREGGKEYELSGTNADRTYVWPGEAITRKVVNGSLEEIITALKKNVKF